MALNPTATRIQLGQELQSLRRTAGMSTTEAAELLHLRDVSTYRKYEAGKVTIPFPSLALLLATWGTASDEERRILLDMREQADSPVWWSRFRLPESMSRLVGFEDMASRISVFELAYVYGPMQTADYARAALRAADPPGTPDEAIEKTVRLRMERGRRLLRSPEAPKLRVVLDEFALRRNVGGPPVMRQQLATLADLSGACELRVLPRTAPAHPGLMGAFQLLEFPDDIRRPSLYVEGPRRSFYLDDETSVGHARGDFAVIWETAHSAGESRELILTVMEEWKE